jgi:uncharacterized protein (DUF58 family)
MRVLTGESLTETRRETGTAVSLTDLIALREEARHLVVAPRGKVLATRSGGHLSRFRGRGMEYDESRLYAPRDDPRNMDWRVTARTGKPYVKLFQEERERPVLPGEDGGHAGFTQAAEHLTRLVRPGSLAFLVSDFYNIAAGSAPWLVRLSEHSEVVLIDIVDPIEMSAPPPGRYPVSDGVQHRFLDTTAITERRAYEHRFTEHAERLATLARQHRAHLLRLRTDAPPGTALAEGLRPRLKASAYRGIR